MDRGELFLRGEIPPLQERRGHSQALPEPTPGIRIAASTPDTFPAIGRRGVPVFASVRHTSSSALAEQIRSYHEAWEEAGHPGKGQVFVSAPTYLAETNDAALAEPRASIMHFHQERANLLEGAAKLVDAETATRRMRRVEQLRSVDYEKAVRTNALVGSPDAIAEKLRTLQAEIGLSGILAELNLRRTHPARPRANGDASVVRGGQTPLRCLTGYSAACVSMTASGVIPRARL